MGQKVHPYGFRLGVTKTWRSRWFAKQDYAKLLMEDIELKAGLAARLKSAGVSSIEVDRPGNKLRITIRTSRPGIVIGRKALPRAVDRNKVRRMLRVRLSHARPAIERYDLVLRLKKAAPRTEFHLIADEATKLLSALTE